MLAQCLSRPLRREGQQLVEGLIAQDLCEGGGAFGVLLGGGAPHAAMAFDAGDVAVVHDVPFLFRVRCFAARDCNGDPV